MDRLRVVTSGYRSSHKKRLAISTDGYRPFSIYSVSTSVLELGGKTTYKKPAEKKHKKVIKITSTIDNVRRVTVKEYDIDGIQAKLKNIKTVLNEGENPIQVKINLLV